jgi:hypothetical protein
MTDMITVPEERKDVVLACGGTGKHGVLARIEHGLSVDVLSASASPDFDRYFYM